MAHKTSVAHSELILTQPEFDISVVDVEIHLEQDVAGGW